jgi:hypothetical protein
MDTSLWVFVGGDNSPLDLLRYVHATDMDVLSHPAARRLSDRLLAIAAAYNHYVNGGSDAKAALEAIGDALGKPF